MTEGQGFARRVTHENLDDFTPRLRKRGESENGETNPGDDEEPSSEIERTEGLFSGESIDTPTPANPSPDSPIPMPEAEKGPLLWDKSMSNSDAQKPPGEDSSYKGELVMLLGRNSSTPDIDASEALTWFREEAFGDLDWGGSMSNENEEEAYCKFSIQIDDEDYGIFRLRLTHRKSRTALDTGTYTATVLHWGPITQILRESDVEGGSLLELYAPPPGRSEPFFIEIDSSPETD